jgi:hypothetical protein
VPGIQRSRETEGGLASVIQSLNSQPSTTPTNSSFLVREKAAGRLLEHKKYTYEADLIAGRGEVNFLGQSFRRLQRSHALQALKIQSPILCVTT